MIELSTRERQALTALFDAFDRHDVRYVVLRKYESLPFRVDDDVDVLIDAPEYDRAVALAERIGFERHYSGLGLSAALRAALRNPRSVPRGGLAALKAGLPVPRRKRRTSHDENRKRKLRYGDLEVDAVNHLACPEGSNSRVPPAVEERMLARRQRRGEVYVPADADELAHFVVHCFVDYHGRLPEYYASKCEVLAEAVSRDDEKRAAFLKLMEILFGNAAESTAERVLSGAFERLTAGPAADGSSAERSAAA